MERNTYRLVDVAQTLLQAFPLGATTDTVVISIYDVDDAALDVNASAMTSVQGNQWKYSWTPSQNHNYIIDYWNQTLDVHDYEYTTITGQIVGVTGGSGTGSTLGNLVTRFLQLIDRYNSTDASDTTAGSGGALARLVINEALQSIYSDTKDAPYAQAYSTTLASTSGQSYMALSAISDFDEIMALQDTTNYIDLIEVRPWKYFFEVPAPSQNTGTPYRYCRINQRLYLDPQPTSSITYTVWYIKNFARLSSDSDQAAIPSKYDYWIYAEAKLLWYQSEDGTNLGQIQIAQKLRDEARQRAITDLYMNVNKTIQSGSHFSRKFPIADPWNHPNVY